MPPVRIEQKMSERIKHNLFKRIVITLCMILSHRMASADENGNVVIKPYTCSMSAISALDFICKAIDVGFGTTPCVKTADNCAQLQQEVFAGLNIEFATAAKWDKWTGFGGAGEIYQTTALCLLRDLNVAPIHTEAAAATPIGNATIKQNVRLLSYDSSSKTVEGVHSAKICVPVVGCIDMFTQIFKFSPLKSDIKGSGQKVGAYDIFTSNSWNIEADTQVQGLKSTLPALSVSTPYGVVSAQPEFGFGRAVGFIGAPFDGNIKSISNGVWGSSKMVDLYGRQPGLKRSQEFPYKFVTGNQIVDFSKIGWLSQLGFGSRSADPKVLPWKPSPAAEEYPLRPDLDLSQARSALEKTPNAYLGANVKVTYNPVGLLPDWIRNSGFLSIVFEVFVKPTIDTAFTSQFDFLSGEISKWDAKIAGDYRPNHLDQFKAVTMFAGTSAYSRFALDSGVDMTLHLHVPLPWPLSDIDEDLINIHPRAVLAEKVGKGEGKTTNNPFAFTQGSAALATKSPFQVYNTFEGPKDGVKHLQACLAAPSTKNDLPPPPEYTPGNPEDLTKDILYPCNICIGMETKTWKDEKGETHKIDGFLQTLFPANEGTRPPSVRWTCDHVYESGCYDMCRYNSTTGELTVVETALEMIAAGRTKNMNQRCR